MEKIIRPSERSRRDSGELDFILFFSGMQMLGLSLVLHEKVGQQFFVRLDSQGPRHLQLRAVAHPPLCYSKKCVCSQNLCSLSPPSSH